ncbi:MAG: DUF5915 domain-containing protein, partial [Actinomycetota bacterium]|nr:DUF5915 domain-containing protein [Actinomycetota bacterium]
LTVAVPDSSRLEPFAELIRAEANVREVTLSEPIEGEYGVRWRLTVLANKAGPRLGPDVQQAIRAAKSGDWSLQDDGTATAGGVTLESGEYEWQLVIEGGESASAILGKGSVILDIFITEDLAVEGVARDLIRIVQQARRDAGMAVSDRIRLGIDGGVDVTEAAERHRDLVARETLATDLELGTVPADYWVDSVVGDGLEVRVTVQHAR